MSQVDPRDERVNWINKCLHYKTISGQSAKKTRYLVFSFRPRPNTGRSGLLKLAFLHTFHYLNIPELYEWSKLSCSISI